MAKRGPPPGAGGVALALVTESDKRPILYPKAGEKAMSCFRSTEQEREPSGFPASDSKKTSPVLRLGFATAALLHELAPDAAISAIIARRESGSWL